MPSQHIWGVIDAFALLVCILLARRHFSISKNRGVPPLPPGPKPLPIIENLLDVPKLSAWLQYQKWAAQYGTLVGHRQLAMSTSDTIVGDVISLTVLGKVIVVMNSHRAVESIAHGVRPSVFSSRPHIKFAEMCADISNFLSLRN